MKTESVEQMIASHTLQLMRIVKAPLDAMWFCNPDILSYQLTETEELCGVPILCGVLTWGVEGTNNTPSLLVRPKRERQVLFFTRLLAATRSKNLKLPKRCSGYNTTLKQLYRKKADDQGPLKDFILIKNTTSVTYWTFVPTQVGT